MRHFIHGGTNDELDFIAYGVTFENMRKILTLRAPYCINNVTGFDYKLKLVDEANNEKFVELKPG